MEQLFILRKLVATVQTQFNNARQGEIVDSDEWADRLLALAHKAFRDLPDCILSMCFSITLVVVSSGLVSLTDASVLSVSIDGSFVRTVPQKIV
jgi:hypothetical protein